MKFTNLIRRVFTSAYPVWFFFWLVIFVFTTPLILPLYFFDGRKNSWHDFVYDFKESLDVFSRFDYLVARQAVRRTITALA